MIRLTPPTVARYVSSGWGADRSYRGGWHAGMDFPAKLGTPMLAAAAGTVAYVKNISNSYAGKYTVIDHGNGIFTRYLHADTNSKRVGDKVRRGEQIGTVGTTGTTSSGPHVHFDVKLSSDALSRFQSRYGAPTTGFSASTRWGRGAPVETFMDGATYRPGVLESSRRRGVVVYKASVTVLGLIAVAGLGWWLYGRLQASGKPLR